MPEFSKKLIALPSARPEISEYYSANDEEIAGAVRRAQENLLRQQKPDGHWCGELIVDSTLCSDYINLCRTEDGTFIMVARARLMRRPKRILR